MAHRYYTSNIAGGTARITGQDAAHLAKVLRARPGEAIVICDGASTDYVGVIRSASPEEVLVDVGEGAPSPNEPSVWVEVFLGYSKGDRLEQAIQKSIELGASAIWPFFSQNCVVKPKKEEAKNERYQRIASEAAKQCGRGILPVVGMPLTFTEVVEKAGALGTGLFLYECGGKALPECVPGQKSIGVITGPEGGFTPAEAALAAQKGLVIIGLGPRILRCETAPVAALAAIMSHTGNLE